MNEFERAFEEFKIQYKGTIGEGRDDEENLDISIRLGLFIDWARIKIVAKLGEEQESPNLESHLSDFY